jgi:hypothetical protein
MMVGMLAIMHALVDNRVDNLCKQRIAEALAESVTICRNFRGGRGGGGDVTYFDGGILYTFTSNVRVDLISLSLTLYRYSQIVKALYSVLLIYMISAERRVMT